MKNFDDYLSFDNKFTIDLSIYSSNRCIRMLGNTKYGQNRFLQKHRLSSSLDDKLFLFSYIQPGDKLFDIIDDNIDYVKIKDNSFNNKSLSFDKSKDYMTMTKLLPLISNNYEWKEWSVVGQVIYNISEGSNDGLEQFIEWSKRDCHKYDEDELIKHWNNYKISDLNIGVLVNKAKKDNPDEYDEIFKKKDQDSHRRISFRR
jgi:hypothetical protein